MKNTWKHWITKGDDNYKSGHYYFFRSFNVYWAYRWYEAQQIDYRSATIPQKTKDGNKIINTNYAERYQK